MRTKYTFAWSLGLCSNVHSGQWSISGSLNWLNIGLHCCSITWGRHSSQKAPFTATQSQCNRIKPPGRLQTRTSPSEPNSSPLQHNLASTTMRNSLSLLHFFCGYSMHLFSFLSCGTIFRLYFYFPGFNIELQAGSSAETASFRTFCI